MSVRPCFVYAMAARGCWLNCPVSRYASDGPHTVPAARSASISSPANSMTGRRLHRAVAGAAAHAVVGGVEPVRAHFCGEDGVGEGELLVVVGVHADPLTGGADGVAVGIHQAFRVVRVEGAEAVHDVDGVDGGLRQRGKGVAEFRILDGGDGHDVTAHLVALGLRVVDHLERDGHLVKVGGHAHEGDGAFRLRADVRLVVAASGVRHDRELDGRVRFADHLEDLLVVREFPRAEVGGVEHRLGRAVAHFHVVHARGEVCTVEGAHEVVGETEVVDEPAVAERGVDDAK